MNLFPYVAFFAAAVPTLFSARGAVQRLAAHGRGSGFPRRSGAGGRVARPQDNEAVLVRRAPRRVRGRAAPRAGRVAKELES